MPRVVTKRGLFGTKPVISGQKITVLKFLDIETYRSYFIKLC